MRKNVLLVGAAVLLVGALARRVVLGCGGIDIENMIERMPENAPPKWMFRNVTAIRTNTARILELLEEEHARSGDGRTAVTV
jgi:hypothetical protein